MDNILRNILRLGLVSIFPIILIVCFLYLFYKPRYKQVIISNYKKILVNTLIFTIIGVVALLVFFYFEDTIYSYDYAGHWQRSLELRKLFFENPSEILPTVYRSMNYNDYSYLPGLFGLGLTIFNTSYGFFALVIFVYFLIPTTTLLQIIYFSYTDKYPYLPLFLFIAFYPLYLTIFFGEVDNIGLFFIAMICLIMLIPKFDEISWGDALLVNLLAFCAIFLRRWYLYSVVALYLCIFIKYLAYYKFKPNTKQAIYDFIKIVSSGIVMLIVILTCFYPFFEKAVFNNYQEAYEFYNRGGKLLAFVNFYSIIIIAIAIFGAIKIFSKGQKMDVLLILLMIIVPTLLFWKTQSFEYHHYYMIALPMFCLFMAGIFHLADYHKNLIIVATSICVIQSICIFAFPYNIPAFTNIKKQPIVLEYKKDVVDFAYYLKSIMSEDWQSAYIASGNSILNDSFIRNSVLPDLDMPQIDFAVLDLRDGFPKDLEYVQYVITIDPILYSDKEFQHIFDVISSAIWNEPMIKEAYNLVHETEIADLNVQVYERIADYTPAMKEYFYKQMLNYYPDKEEFFAYILE